MTIRIDPEAPEGISEPGRQQKSVTSVPAVVIGGKLGGCCTGRGPDEATLHSAGLGQPFEFKEWEKFVEGGF